MHFDRSRSFKVIDLCTNRKPIHDFLLVINCDLGSIFHRFRDIACEGSWKPGHSSVSPSRGDPFEFHWDISPLCIENCAIPASVVMSQYTPVTDDDRQTTYHDNSRTLQCNCNVRLKLQIRTWLVVEVFSTNIKTINYVIQVRIQYIPETGR